MGMIDLALADLGYVCIEAQWESKEETLRIFIDGPEGVLIDDCVKATKILREWPALDTLIGVSYQLEVSSPGIERPLRKLTEFQKVVGKEVALQVRDGSDAHWLSGVLAEADSEGLKVTKPLQEGFVIRLDQIEAAHLVYDWNNSL